MQMENPEIYVSNLDTMEESWQKVFADKNRVGALDLTSKVLRPRYLLEWVDQDKVKKHF